MAAAITTVISADTQERVRQFVRDLWQYRELFWSFVERDIKVRYKQTALGVIWVILQPLFMSGAFALIFGRLGAMPTDNLPGLLFYMAALVPWTTFASALSQSALSVESQSGLITKVYFPRLVVPGAVVIGSMLDFAIGWVLLNGVAMWFGLWHWRFVLLTPVLLFVQMVTALGAGAALAALNAQYRDVKHTMGFLVQVWMLATPVIYPMSSLPAVVRQVEFLNPMAAVVTTYRNCFQGLPTDWSLLGSSVGMGLLYLAAGVWVFRKLETRMADVL